MDRQADPNYRNVQVFGVSGQAQKGIDIPAGQLVSSGLTVGQCKRYQTLTDSQVAGANGQPGSRSRQGIPPPQGVLESGRCGYLHTLRILRYDQRKVQAEFLRQRRRLKKLGIVFELWSDSTLTGRLRSHPGIVSEYLAHDWPSILCGGSLVLQPTGPSHVSQFIVTQLEQISTQYADAIERDLETARKSWWAGSRREAQAAVERYRQPHIWNALVATTRSSV